MSSHQANKHTSGDFFKYIGMEDLAQEVLEAPSAVEAKEITSRAPRDKFLHTQ